MPGKKTFFKSKSATTAAKGPGKALSLYKHNVGWSGDKHDQHTKAPLNGERQKNIYFDLLLVNKNLNISVVEP